MLRSTEYGPIARIHPARTFYCPDHVCLFEPEQGWLFSGDLFIHERVRYLRNDEDACAATEQDRLLGERGQQALRRQGPALRAISDRLLGREGWITRTSRGTLPRSTRSARTAGGMP